MFEVGKVEGIRTLDGGLEEVKAMVRSFAVVITLLTITVGLSDKPLAKGTKGTKEDPKFVLAREKMVEKQLKGRDITDEKVLAVMGEVPRHLFVDKRLRDVAYSDRPLPIGEGQTISQPYIVALMTQWLKVDEDDKVLEVGTGSGYQAAILAEIVDRVYTVEIREKLADTAAKRLKRLGYTKVEVKCADGYFGWKDHAPFDGIVVTAAADHIPPPLIGQLKEGGRMVIPVGSPWSYQKLVLLEKKKGEIFSTNITGVLFVPMIREIKQRRP